MRDKLVRSRTIYEGKAYDFVELTLEMPSGQTRLHPMVRHNGAAVILPILEKADGSREIVFVRNERHTIGKTLLELPAGGIDPGETPDQTAPRELREETGYEAQEIRRIGAFYTTPGLTDELMHVYLATGLTMKSQELQADESLTVQTHPVQAVARMLDEGTLMDGKSIVALLLAKRQGLLDL